MELSENAKQARRDYNNLWRKANKSKVLAYNRKWQRENPEKVVAAKLRYWEKKAKDQAKRTTIEKNAVELHLQGLSLRNIAKQLGINHMRVKRIIDEAAL